MVVVEEQRRGHEILFPIEVPADLIVIMTNTKSIRHERGRSRFAIFNLLQMCYFMSDGKRGCKAVVTDDRTVRCGVTHRSQLRDTQRITFLVRDVLRARVA